MKTELVKAPKVNGLVIHGGAIVPAIIADAGEKAGKRFIEFLTATIRNANTRRHMPEPSAISSRESEK
jgi:hypothetical protein